MEKSEINRDRIDQIVAYSLKIKEDLLVPEPENRYLGTSELVFHFQYEKQASIDDAISRGALRTHGRDLNPEVGKLIDWIKNNYNELYLACVDIVNVVNKLSKDKTLYFAPEYTAQTILFRHIEWLLRNTAPEEIQKIAKKSAIYK